MNLYSLQTKGLGEFYVVAGDATQADQELTRRLDDKNYGISDDRLVLNTRLIAREAVDYGGGLWFSGGRPLLIIKGITPWS
jgi:hypothetical protein